MAKYYRRVTKGIEPGLLAKSEDINTIQTNVDEAVTAQLIDCDGEAFVLGHERDVFELNVPETHIDQQHISGDLDWQTLQNHHICQELKLLKSSIRRVNVQMRNTLNKEISVKFYIADQDVTHSSNNQFNILKELVVDVPISNEGTDVILDFDLNHLIPGTYYLLIERTNLSGVSIRYDKDGGYGGLLSRSVDRVDYLSSSNDLYFICYYGTDLTFDMVPGEAVVLGHKIVNKDTHITIGTGSGYAPRIDIVYMDYKGELYTVEGEPASSPKKPEIPTGSLRIATLFVPMQAGSASSIQVDQDDSFFINRPRSQLERLRRLEKRAEWDWIYNRPRRVKYIRDPPFIDEGASSGIDFDGDTGEYRITSATGDTFIETLENTDKIDLANTTMKIDTDVRSAFITGQETIKTGIRIPPGGTPEEREASYVYREGRYRHGYTSRYVYMVYTSPFTFTLDNVTIWLSVLQHAKEIYLNIIDDNANVSVARSTRIRNAEYIVVNNRSYSVAQIKDAKERIEKFKEDHGRWPNFVTIDGQRVMMEHYKPFMDLDLNVDGGYSHRAIGTSSPITFDFPTKPTLEKGKRYRMSIIAVPANSGNSANPTGIIKFHTLPLTLLGDVTPGTNPNYGTRSAYYISLPGPGTTTNFTHFIPTWLNGHTESLATTGTLQSIVKTTTSNIKSLSIDKNINVPDGTTYELYVSNNGGDDFFKVTGDNFTFSNHSNEFVYKLVFNTEIAQNTPELLYDSNKGYAIKFDLSFVEGEEPPTNGTLVTTPLDGATISENAIGVDGFSHFEFLRVWAKENGQTLTIDIQYYDEGETQWEDWKTGLTLSDFRRHSVDFDMWDEAPLDDNEHNFYCDHYGDASFPWRCARFIFYLSRESGYDPSPTIQNIGAVILLT